MEYLLYKNDIFIKKCTEDEVKQNLGNGYVPGTLVRGYRAIRNEETDPSVSYMNAQSDPHFYMEELSASEIEEIHERNKIYELSNDTF